MAESFSKASSLVLWISTDAHLYDDPDDASIPPFLLDSRFDSDKSEALKRLLVLIAQGADVSHFFPQVMKNVASPSLEVKKLVYLQLPLTMDAKRVRHEYKAKKISEEKYVNAMKGEISRVVKPLRRNLTLRNCN